MSKGQKKLFLEMPPDPPRSSLNCINPHCLDCMNYIVLYFELYDTGNMEEIGKKVEEMSGQIEELKEILQEVKDQQTGTSSSKG